MAWFGQNFLVQLSFGPWLGEDVVDPAKEDVVAKYDVLDNDEKDITHSHT